MTTESLRVPQAWFYFLLGWDSLELSLTLEHGPYSRVWFLQAFLGLKWMTKELSVDPLLWLDWNTNVS